MTTGNGREGETLLYAPFCLADSSHWLGEGERKQAKQDAGVQLGTRDLCYQNGNAPLLMKVYLLPIVSCTSPVKGSFIVSVFVHQL